MPNTAPDPVDLLSRLIACPSVTPDDAGSFAYLEGVLADAGGRRHRRVNIAHALSEAQHPAGRLAGRRLKTT